MEKLCDSDCNNCPVVNHPNSMMLTKILNKLYDKFGDGVYEIVEENCPNFTVCRECCVDDFVHVEGCTMSVIKRKKITKEKELDRWTETFY